MHHRVGLLEQEASRILQRVELTFARGNGDLLRAQFALRLLQAGLQRGLLAQQRFFAAVRNVDLVLQPGQLTLQPGDLILPAEDG